MLQNVLWLQTIYLVQTFKFASIFLFVKSLVAFNMELVRDVTTQGLITMLNIGDLASFVPLSITLPGTILVTKRDSLKSVKVAII